MRLRFHPSARPGPSTAMLAAGLLAFAPAAQAAPGSLGGFRLPPDPDTAAQEPAPQGPVAPDVPASAQVLRPSPSASPSPSPTPIPAPAPTASAVVQPLPAATPATALPSVTPPPPPEQGLTRLAEPSATPSPTPQAEEGAAAALPATPGTTPFPLPGARPVVAADSEDNGTAWLWIVGAIVALAALALAWFLRRRSATRLASAAPTIERPTLSPPEPASDAAAPAEPAPTSASEPRVRAGLELELEPRRLSLTLMNATLSYRLLLNNLGDEPLENLAVSADMIAAHAALTREQQLSGPDAGALQVACIERLEPGEGRIVSGEFRLPFGQIMPVRQGNAALLFPLARFRIEGGGEEPLTRTFLVAQPPLRDGGGLQPFRLDLGPRVYPQLAQRAFA